jgi:protein TonB
MQTLSRDFRPLPSTRSNTNRAVGLVVAVIVQLAAIWLLATGLVTSGKRTVPPPLQASVVQEQQKTEDLPPPPPPAVDQPPPPSVPPPEITLDLTEAPPPSTTITTTPPVAAPVAPAKPDTPPAPIGRGLAVTDADYPALSVTLTEQGTVIVSVQVLADGSVGEVKVAKSSGYPRLDERALEIVKQRGKFRPASRQGTPVEMTVNLPIVFKLNRR